MSVENQATANTGGVQILSAVLAAAVTAVTLDQTIIGLVWVGEIK